MIAPETALVACRFVFDGATVFLWGSSAYLAGAVPPVLAHRVAVRLGFAQCAAAVLALLAVAARLPSEAAMIGDGWPSVDLALIGDVLSGTGAGVAWLAQAIGSLLLCLLLPARCLVAKGYPSLAAKSIGSAGVSPGGASSPNVGRQGALAILSALLLATLSITGHAAMDGGWLGAAHRTNHILHLLSGGFWLGALVPVLAILRRLADPQARLALMRFSTSGHVAVALVIATGLIDTLLVVGKLPLDWSLPYQLLLAAKMALVAVMVGLAVVNRYVFVPRLARNRDGATAAILRATMAEIAIGTAVLALVAWFGTLDPH